MNIRKAEIKGFIKDCFKLTGQKKFEEGTTEYLVELKR